MQHSKWRNAPDAHSCDRGRIGLGRGSSSGPWWKALGGRSPVGSGGEPSREPGGNWGVKDQEWVGLHLLPSNAARHPTLGYLGPSSWPRQVAATRNPWLTSPSDLNLSDRWLFGRTGTKSAWVGVWLGSHTHIDILHRRSYGCPSRSVKLVPLKAVSFPQTHHYVAAVSYWWTRRKNTAWQRGTGVFRDWAKVCRNGGFVRADGVPTSPVEDEVSQTPA